METEELRRLFETSMKRIDELVLKYELGLGLSRRDCVEMQKCNERLHLIGRELLLLDGSDDPAFDCFRQPYVKQPLPASMRPLNLPGDREVH